MPDYFTASERHWNDAKLLLENSCLPNADQLFGLSAECALKAIMLPLGMPMKNGRPIDGKRHGHINVLWDEFITFATGKNQAHFASMLGNTNPFLNWDVGQRYEDGSAISRQIVSDHEKSAEITRSCLVKAMVDGILV